MATVDEPIGSKDLTQIVKGKRTKRQRLQSPIPFTITPRSSRGDDNVNSSQASSAEVAGSTTEEDEDTAKCLILLAQGPLFDFPRNHQKEFKTYKFTSKRYVEAPTTANGKAGIYVYECRTCNRTFPSFQALGGHRASHKKNKPMMAEENKSFMVLSDDEEAPFKNRLSSLSLQLSHRGVFNNKTTKASKVHECSICGTEFTSGQALGGHMRRHRGPVGTNTTLSLSPMSTIPVDPLEEAKKKGNALSLDLNLPAPDDDHHPRDKFVFVSKQQQEQQPHQQSGLGLSVTPTLVDCHN